MPSVSREGDESSRKLHLVDGKYLTMVQVLKEVPIEELDGLHPGHPRLVKIKGKNYFSYGEWIEAYPKELDLLFEFGSIYQIQNGKKVLISSYAPQRKSLSFQGHSRKEPMKVGSRDYDYS